MKKLFLYVLLFSASNLFALTLGLSNSGPAAGKIDILSVSGQSLGTCNNFAGPNPCSLIIPVGKIQLKATPVGGSTFLSWNSGTGSTISCGQAPNQTNPTCTVDLNQNSSLKYEFTAGAPLPLTIRFSVGADGRINGQFLGGTNILNCTSNCTQNVNAGTVVTLNAIPGPGSTFLGWANGTGSTSCTGTSPCKFVMSQSSDISAKFNTPLYGLTVTTGQTGTGTVLSEVPSGAIQCQSPGTARTCSAKFPQKVIRLKATPGTNSVFTQWSGGTGSAAACNNSNNPVCEFTINQTSSIKANFVPNNL
jgi:hypothetical protein